MFRDYNIGTIDIGAFSLTDIVFAGKKITITINRNIISHCVRILKLCTQRGRVRRERKPLGASVDGGKSSYAVRHVETLVHNR